MKLKLWVSGGWINVKETDPIKSTRRLNSFCVENCLPNCVVKAQGGWYWIDQYGFFHFIEKTLSEITFENLFNLLNK